MQDIIALPPYNPYSKKPFLLFQEEVLSAYFGKGVDSRGVFRDLRASSYGWYERHLNMHNVIHITFNEVPDDCASYKEYISRISELNMFYEYTMATREKYSEYFGFTDEEVDELYRRYLEMEQQPAVSREGLRVWAAVQSAFCCSCAQ